MRSSASRRELPDRMRPARRSEPTNRPISETPNDDSDNRCSDERYFQNRSHFQFTVRFDIVGSRSAAGQRHHSPRRGPERAAARLWFPSEGATTVSPPALELNPDNYRPGHVLDTVCPYSTTESGVLCFVPLSEQWVRAIQDRIGHCEKRIGRQPLLASQRKGHSLTPSSHQICRTAVGVSDDRLLTPDYWRCNVADIDRRDFIKSGAAAVTVTSACLCGLSGCATYTGVSDTPAANPDSISLDGSVLSVNIASEPALREIGGAVKVRHADFPDGLIIARVEENRYAIASLLCTHRGVELEYDRERTRFQCPSLGSSVFTLDGARVSGPARRPLEAYEAVLEGDILTIRV